MQIRQVLIAAAVSVCGLGAQIEPAAGTWKTWVVPSVNQIRLPAPPTAAASAAEIQTIKSLMAESNPDTRAQVAYWDAGPPGYRWMQLASQQMLAQNVAAPLFTRGMALVAVAIYDATIAAWDSKYAWNRPAPSAMDSTIQPLITIPKVASYPSEHAVVAGAVTGGGLTVIANAPNPAGQAILGRFFPDGVAPLYLFLGALLPTLVVAAVFLIF